MLTIPATATALDRPAPSTTLDFIYTNTMRTTGIDPAVPSATIARRIAATDAWIAGLMTAPYKADHPSQVTPIRPRVFDAPADDWCNHCEEFIHLGDSVIADAWGGFTHAACGEDIQVTA